MLCKSKIMGASVFVCISVYVYVLSALAHWCPKNTNSGIESPKNQLELSLEAHDASDSINSSQPSDSDTECCTEPCL